MILQWAALFPLLGVAGLARAEPVDELVRAAMQRERVPGVALLVVRSGKVARASGYGLANVEHDVPVRRDTLFQSGSLGKQFTAAAVLMLAERRQLALVDPVGRYLPDPPPPWALITVQRLLDHTSGIHDSEEDGEVFDLRREYTDAEIIKVAYSYPLDFAPGSRWKYNNMGYVLAGIIVTRLTGAHYGEFLRREIFAPLGMRTARVISDTDIVPHRAAGYVRTAQGIRNQDFVSASLNATADGSLYLSLDDWAAWIAAMDRGALLRPASWSAMWERSVLSDGRRTEHGLCFDHVMVAGHAVLEFDGSWQGFRSAIERDPASALTVIVLENLAEAQPVPLARAVLAHLEPAADR
ncbi:MAG: beta-lactamase family protein [Gammaproteobacteria bacterium]|nr:beta-lactamase family protein [Gammaproteobacteria bacterium]MBV8306329.1 beta-lactamase family protein [Gammaproteobacteria bacterium]MBV8402568.1 beta-lactamase family protein [Gammaproteobacteria bacterium]